MRTTSASTPLLKHPDQSTFLRLVFKRGVLGRCVGAFGVLADHLGSPRPGLKAGAALLVRMTKETVDAVHTAFMSSLWSDLQTAGWYGLALLFALVKQIQRDAMQVD